MIRTIYGKSNSPYRTDVRLTPHTRWGQLVLHIFYRGDEDPSPHDHPWDFWTFPLTSYYEQKLTSTGTLGGNIVEAWRWHYRPAEYIHRLDSNIPSCRPFIQRLVGSRVITLVWRKPVRRFWGFWLDVRHMTSWVKMDHVNGWLWIQAETYFKER